MTILHATWAETKLFFWCETRSEQGATDVTTRPLESSPPLHFNSSATGALNSLLSSFDIDTGEPAELALLLPGFDKDTPAPSSELTSETTGLALYPYTVHGITLPHLDALHLLSSLPAVLPSLNELHPGDSTLFWIEATKFLLDLLCRGRAIPDLQRRNQDYYSAWRLCIIERKDIDALNVLNDCIPPVVGAKLAEGKTATTLPTSVCLQEFLDTSADVLIRTFLRRHPILNPEEAEIAKPSHIVPARWLASLTLAASSSSPSSDSLATGSLAPTQIEGPIIELLKFEARIRQWNAPLLRLSKRIPLKLVFFLNPPYDPEQSDIWDLRFGLASETSPHQILKCETLWSGNLGFLGDTDYTIEELEEICLTELGKILRIYPQIKQAMLTDQPQAITLGTEQAHRFLKEFAPLLERAGYTITLPEWWNQRLKKLGLTLEVSSPTVPSSTTKHSSALGLNTLLDFSWKISIGEDSLSEEEVENIVKSGSSLVYLRGSWVELQSSKLKSTLDFLQQQKEHPQMTLLEALRLGFNKDAKEDDALLPVVNFQSSGWIRQLISRQSNDFALLEQSKLFQGSLRQYQLEGLSWLSLLDSLGIGCCLADDMGLGKTIQFIALLLHERDDFLANPQQQPVLPTLLIVPMSILGNWKNEVEKFAPTLRVSLHHGAQRPTAMDFLEIAKNSDVVVTTYSLAFRDEDLLSQVNWGRIALDEAQNIKNLSTKQTKAIRRISSKQLTRSAVLGSCRRIALTGTPLENHLEELWSIFDFLNPGFLGQLEQFRRDFAIPIERYRSKEASDNLSSLVRPFILRRLKSDPQIISDLPEKIEIREEISLTPEQSALYRAVLDQLLPQVEQAQGIHRKGMVLSVITRLKQICNHPALYLGQNSLKEATSAKTTRLEELLETQIAEGDRTLIFTQYAQMGKLLQGHLSQRFNQEVLFLHGGLTRKQREKVLSAFQTPKGPQIFILSLKAGGIGLNLVEANQVVHYDQWWNPAVHQQATDRAHRIGQKQSVQVRTLITKGTLEEKIEQLLSRKQQLAANIVTSARNTVTELSNDQLRDLLALSDKLDDNLDRGDSE